MLLSGLFVYYSKDYQPLSSDSPTSSSDIECPINLQQWKEHVPVMDYIPAEPVNPVMNSLLLSQSAMYSLY